MSTNSIDFSKIKYNNPDHVFITTGNTNANGIIDVEDLINGYNKIFGTISLSEYLGGKISEGEGLALFSKIKESLGSIIKAKGNDHLNLDFIIKKETLDDDIRKEKTNEFYASAKTINEQTIDSKCLEGYRAYSFYLEKIVLLLNKLNDAIKQGQDAINEIKNLKVDSISADQTEEECVNTKVHELSAELYMADKVIADVKAEFKSCLKYNANTKSWDKSSYGYGIDDAKFTKPTTLDNLRGITVAVSNANDLNDTHKISCFSELNLLDRLRYIRYYYELILEGNDSDYQVFPDDPEKGYPCVPDIESNTDTKATESMGGFELFYVGYLVDRDGSIDAYSSCLEAKSKAITDNISLQSKHIEAYNQYLTFINRAAQLLNESQSGGTNNIPNGAHLALTYFCGGTMRDLLEVDGVNYIVLSYTKKEGGDATDGKEDNTDFNYGVNHRYLLVRADECGLNALYNTGNLEDPNGGVSINENNTEKKVTRLELITTGDLEFFFTSDKVKYDCDFTVSGFTGTTFYKRAYSFDYSGDCPIIVSSGDKKEILIWETKDLENDKKYLPKQLVIQEIAPNSVAQYDNYQNMNAWGNEADAKNRVISSWTTAFSNKSEYINTAIETINTDITSLRTKMDTIDSLCSTLRNRSFETKKTLISNLHS